jgi:hypothetical protein
VIASVDVSGLLELAWVVPLAVLAVAVTFSVCVLGVTRASDARREGNQTAASGFVALAVLSGAAFAGVVVLGVAVIVNG